MEVFSGMKDRNNTALLIGDTVELLTRSKPSSDFYNKTYARLIRVSKGRQLKLEHLLKPKVPYTFQIPTNILKVRDYICS